MYNLADINTIKSVLEKNGFSFSKSLGQNFLVNPDVCPDMADEAVITESDGIIEIGAGIGVLTAELCKRAKKVVSVELDSRLLPVLGETLADFNNVEIINEDILKLDLHKLISEKFGDCENVSVCANLPYYITSPVIMKLLEDRLPLKQIVVMVQKEAAQRLTAAVGTRNSGAITVAVNYYAQAETLFEVGRESFIPSPKVDSAVIRLLLHKDRPVEINDDVLFFRMVRAIFMQRRKTALNGISAGLNLERDTVRKAMESIELSPEIRAEKLDMQQLGSLSNALGKVIKDV